jgi:hypothetical protein
MFPPLSPQVWRHTLPWPLDSGQIRTRSLARPCRDVLSTSLAGWRPGPFLTIAGCNLRRNNALGPVNSHYSETITLPSIRLSVPLRGNLTPPHVYRRNTSDLVRRSGFHALPGCAASGRGDGFYGHKQGTGLGKPLGLSLPQLRETILRACEAGGKQHDARRSYSPEQGVRMMSMLGASWDRDG